MCENTCWFDTDSAQLGGKGVIRYAESNDDPKQLPNFDKIKETLARLK